MGGRGIELKKEEKKECNTQTRLILTTDELISIKNKLRKMKKVDSDSD